jgi:hypothetical protein
MTRGTPPENQSRSREYRDAHLGLFSSHPYWLERGSYWIRRTLVGTAVFLYFLVTYLWLRGQGIDQMIPSIGTWLVSESGGRVAGFAAFIGGMMAAASFQLRMALRKQVGDLARQRDLPVSFSPATAVLVVLVGFVLPLVVSFAPELPIEIRFFGALIALTPVVTLSLLLPSPPSRAARFPWFSGGILLPLLVLGGASDSASSWVHAHLPQVVIDHFPLLRTPDTVSQFCTVVCSMSAVVFAFKFVSWIRGLKLSKDEEIGAAPEKKLSFWRRLLHALGFGVAAEDEAVRLAREAEERHRQLLTWAVKLAEDCGFAPEAPSALAPDPGEVSQFCEDSSFDLLFHGRRATLDQFKALRDFSDLSIRCIDDPEGRVDGTGFEMIIEGPAGSGRSSVLDAMAMLTLLAQGSGTVMLVADAGRINFAIQRLRNQIASIHLAPYATVGSIQDAWSRAGRGEAPTDICVTTPELWEQSLPGRMVREGADYETARSLMVHYSTMLVDDWLEHPVEVRAHLPFILDKHRLFLESEMLPRASVVAFPSLTDTGRNLAVSRLMGDAGVIDESRQVIRLRHRPLPATTIVDVVCDSIDAAIDKLASALSQSGEASILLRKGIDFEEAERQTLDYQTRYHGSQIRVCYCGDQVETIDGELRAILMKAACGPEAVFALRAHRLENSLVMIRVRDRREIGSTGRITPLIVDRSGRGMAESHLRNILRFMEPASPVSRRCWGQLGLDIPAQTGGKFPSQPAGALVLDLPELLPEAERRARPYLSKLGSYVSLKEAFKYLESVDCHWIPDPGPLPVARAAAGQNAPGCLYLSVPDESANRASGSSVLWLGNEGSEIGRSQLHYADMLLLKRHRIFCPDRIREVASRGLEIDATKFRDNGSDAVHPKIEMNWFGEVSPAVEAGSATVVASEDPWQLSTGYGGPAHGFIWADLGSAAGVLVNSRLIERVDDQDRPSPCFAYKYEWHARVRPLLLCPTDEVIHSQQEYREALKAFFSEATPWGTEHSGFLPGLTYALTRGLEIDLPSSGFFGKILAFRLDGEMGRFAKAVVWFVEPSGTGRTLSNAVHELFKEDRYLEDLATRMDLILRQGWEKSPPSELARFWLPRRNRKAVTLAERRVVAHLLGDTAPVNTTGETLPHKVLCPYCQLEHHWDVAKDGGFQYFTHCDQTVAMMVPTAGGLLASPASLVEGWWPAGFPLPKGTMEEKCLAAWGLIAQRVAYCLDKHQREAIHDCWLPAHETWQREVGDCEDHSILLASMLTHLGVNVWLVWGEADGGGHAWVEVEIDGDLRLMETTAKQPLPLHLPLVKEVGIVYSSSYQPSKQIPARTNGTLYSKFENDQWHEVKIVDAVSRNVVTKSP